jgi:hypothetical protein
MYSPDILPQSCTLSSSSSSSSTTTKSSSSSDLLLKLQLNDIHVWKPYPYKVN